MSKEKEEYKYSLYGQNVLCASVAVILTQDKDLLLIKRAQRENDPWSGHIGFPGGKQEDKDNLNPLMTAIRETHEEIGIKLDESKLIRPLKILLPDNDFKGYKLECWPFLFELDEKYNLRIDKSEVQDVIRLPLEVVIKRFYLKERSFKLMNGRHLKLPSLTLSCGEVVWGLTLMILQDIHQLYKNKM